MGWNFTLNLLMSAKTSTWHWWNSPFGIFSRFDVTIHLVSHSETLYRLKSLFQSPIFHGDKRISRIYPPQPKLVVVKWDLANLPIFLWIFQYEFSEVSPSNDRKFGGIATRTSSGYIYAIYLGKRGPSYHGPIHQFVLKSWGRGRFHPIHLLLCRVNGWVFLQWILIQKFWKVLAWSKDKMKTYI